MNGVVKKEKLKILALHGYRQNCETFRQKTGSFRKIVNKWAEFTFITAPHKVIIESDEFNEQNNDEEQFGWFFNREDKSFRGTRQGGPAIGFDDSLKLVEETYEKLGPFDGILGFSQGACFVGLLCNFQQRGLLNIQFKFAVMVAGFKSGSVEHSEFYKHPISLPSLHVFGEGDQIIPLEMSQSLSECFIEPMVLKHSGGHFVPASSSQKETYQTFFEEQFIGKVSHQR